LAKKQRKILDIKKQRDREQMDRFSCNGHIKITINSDTQIVKLEMQHDLLHIRPEKYNVAEEVKNSIRQYIHLVPKDIFSILEVSHPKLTQKQVHYWWTQIIQEQYKKDDNQLVSSQIHLKEFQESQNNKMLLLNIKSDIQYLAFTTIFFDQMKNNDEIVVDATCKNLNVEFLSFLYYNFNKLYIVYYIVDKTNALRFELYAVVGQIDGCGYPLAYLFLDNAKKSDGIRKAILCEFFQSLKEGGLTNLKLFLTDKDWAQINAALQVWPNIKVQLCLWHLKKAVSKRLADNTLPKVNNYSAGFAKMSVEFIDDNFVPFNNRDKKGFEFCPKHLREEVLELIVKHFHLHSLIPNDDNKYLSIDEIWITSVKEMYSFCVKYDLRYVWGYMWINWYEKKHWTLWARAANYELCLFKTTMLVESHWKVIKRDFLPKFFRPRLDLVIFIIIKRLLPHYQQRQNRIIQGREKPSWRKEFKKEWRICEKHEKKENTHVTDVEKWVCSCNSFLLSRWPICYHLVQLKKDLENDPAFFTKVKRQGIYPFLTMNKANAAFSNPDGKF